MASKLKMTGQGPRRDRIVQEHRHDTYRLSGKLKAPTVCSGCGALFHKGRWTWGAAPKGAKTTTCPACHRMQDKYPMGLLTIAGSFKEAQRTQVMGVIHNAAAQEKKEHPLSRIMAVERRPEGLVISTTDTHLPRRIGEALTHAYRGELAFHYDQDEEFIRVNWTR